MNKELKIGIVGCGDGSSERVEDFVESVLSKADKPPVTGEDGLKALQVIAVAI